MKKSSAISVALLCVILSVASLFSEEAGKPVAATRPTNYSTWPFDPNEAARRQDDAARELGVPKVTSLAIDGLTIELVLIPSGRFVMGSPEKEVGRQDDETQHEVLISRPFYMGACEVTQEQYRAVMGSNPSMFPGAAMPVENMKVADAFEFCSQLSKKTGRTVRLPTEAEWEYSCRAGSATAFSFGDDPNGLIEFAWYREKVDAGKKKQPQAVRQKKPNAFGLYDMHGNVSEVCQDWYGKNYYREANHKVDPQGPASSSIHHRCVRGGWYGATAEVCRSAWRFSLPMEEELQAIGFRIVVDLEVGRRATPATGRGTTRVSE